MRRGVFAAVSVLALLIAAAAVPGSAEQVGLAARVFPVSKTREEPRAFPVFDAGGNAAGTASWRIVNGIGNCCEAYLGVTTNGRLLSLGGDILEYSDDRGITWNQVWTGTIFFGAEGAVNSAPDGDIVGLTWDPYTGDRVVSFKYEASEDRWYWLEGNLHNPFADRPWVSVVPGPFQLGAVTVPYLSVLSAGTAGSREILYVSTDGLSYVLPNTTLSDALTNTNGSRFLDLPADSQIDAMQPTSKAAIVPLPGGGGLAQGVFPGAGCRWRIIEKTNPRWACFSYPTDPPTEPWGEIQVDSKGRIHELYNDGPEWFVYRISRDGGRSWAESRIHLPTPYEAERWDFRANGSLDLTAIAVHAANYQTNLDQDMVIKIDTSGDVPVVQKTMFVGTGGVDFKAGIFSSGYRFDFASVVILPDGKVATAFGDSSHRNPEIAVEL